MTAVKVEKIVKETPDITTIYFPRVGEARPGQYLMVWIPSVDEVPMSLSTIGDISSFSVRVVGDATRALSQLKQGDKIGLRGPFGNGYTVNGKHPFLVGGGSGIASLTPLAEEMVAKGVKPTFLIGARSADQLLFKRRLGKLLGDSLMISTDDGSEGFHGYASNYAGELMAKGKYDQVYAYEAADTADPWKHANTAMPDVLNDLAQMAPGRGYWIHVTEDCTWTLP